MPKCDAVKKDGSGCTRNAREGMTKCGLHAEPAAPVDLAPSGPTMDNAPAFQTETEPSLPKELEVGECPIPGLFLRIGNGHLINIGEGNLVQIIHSELCLRLSGGPARVHVSANALQKIMGRITIL